MSTESFNNKYYSILLSLNERTIYIKATDNINYLMYETNVDLKELRLLLDLKDVYKIMVKCFSVEMNNNDNNKIMIKDLDYNVNLIINSSVMKMTFSALVGGYLNISFEILLREKLMSNDGQLTVNFNRLEQQQAQAIDMLTKKCNNLEGLLAKQQKQSEQDIQRLMDIINKMEVFVAPAHHWTHRTHTHITTNIASTVVTIQNADTQMFIERNIAAFYKLQKLTIGNFISVSNFKTISNETVTEIELQCASNGTFTSLEGIQNFPNLEILTVTNAPGLKDVVTVLKATKHKIKTLKFQGCTAVNVVELQTYCQVNNIFLAIS
jgi:hypothetical protein